MLRKFKLPIVIIAIVLLNQAAGLGIQALAAGSMLAAGTTRYAVASSSVSALTFPSAWGDVPYITRTVTIPSGHVGEVMIFFCANGYVDSAGGLSPALLVRALVGTTVASPDSLALIPSAGSDRGCANFYKTGVKGTKVVKMQWMVTANSANLYNRNMIVIVNIH